MHFIFALQILCCLLLAVTLVATAPIDSDPTDSKKRVDIPSTGDTDNFLMRLQMFRFIALASILG